MEERLSAVSDVLLGRREPGQKVAVKKAPSERIATRLETK